MEATPVSDVNSGRAPLFLNGIHILNGLDACQAPFFLMYGCGDNWRDLLRRRYVGRHICVYVRHHGIIFVVDKVIIFNWYDAMCPYRFLWYDITIIIELDDPLLLGECPG